MAVQKVQYAEKLKEVIKVLKVSKRIASSAALAESIGLSSSALSEITSGRNHIPVKLIEYLELKFMVNPQYIFGSDPEMFMDAHETNNPVLIPIYEVESISGVAEVLDDSNSSLVKSKIVDPNFADCSIGSIVRSDAMLPQIKPGDRIMLKRIIDYDIIPFGEPFLVITAEQFLIRNLRKSLTPDFWRLTAANPAFDDMEIPIAKVSRIYQVKGITSRIS